MAGSRTSGEAAVLKLCVSLLAVLVILKLRQLVPVLGAGIPGWRWRTFLLPLLTQSVYSMAGLLTGGAGCSINRSWVISSVSKYRSPVAPFSSCEILSGMWHICPRLRPNDLAHCPQFEIFACPEDRQEFKVTLCRALYWCTKTQKRCILCISNSKEFNF